MTFNLSNFTNFSSDMPGMVREEITDVAFIQQFCSSFQNYQVWLWISPLIFCVLYYVFKRRGNGEEVLMADLMLLFVAFACIMNLAVLLL